MNNYQQLVESSIIVGTGLFMHLNRISVIELRHSKLPMLTPNAASSLFVFSVLCVLTKLRPLWPNALRKPQRFLIFLIEMALILYATDFLLRQVWLPSLKLLNFICHFLSQYVVVANEDYLARSAPRFSSWIRNDAFYLARFFLAVVAFIFMIDITGMTDVLCAKFKFYKGGVGFMSDNSSMNDDDEDDDDNRGMRDDEDDVRDENDDIPVTSARRDEFNVNDLPYVPQEDLLNIGHRVGARRRRNPIRKSKRLAKLMLNDPDNECFC